MSARLICALCVQLLTSSVQAGDVAEVRQRLASPDPDVREAAIKRLGTLGDRALAVAPDLVRAISDHEPAVHKAALLLMAEWALLQDRTPELVEQLRPGLPRLVECLRSSDGLVQRDAAEIIEFLGPDAVVPADQIAATLPGCGLPASAYIARTLRRMGPRGLRPLLAAFGKCDEPTQTAILHEMKLSSWPVDDEELLSRAVDVLTEATLAESGALRINAYRTVQQMGIKMLPLLVNLAVRDGPETSLALRSQAIRSISDLREHARSAAPRLLRLLDNPQLRSDAALAILQLDADAEALLPAAEVVLRGDQIDVCLQAVQELQRLADDPKARKILDLVLNHREPRLQIAGIDAIRRHTDKKDLAAALASLCGAEDVSVQRAAGIALADLRQRLELAIPILRKAVIDEPQADAEQGQPDPFGPPARFFEQQELDWLSPRSSEPDPLVDMDLRVLCVRALCRLGPAAEEARGALRGMFSEDGLGCVRLEMECVLALLAIDADPKNSVTEARDWLAKQDYPAAQFRLAERFLQMRVGTDEDFEVVLPYLRRVPHDAVTLRAVQSLGSAGRRARAALPDLERLMFSPFKGLGDAADQAVRAIRAAE